MMYCWSESVRARVRESIFIFHIDIDTENILGEPSKISCQSHLTDLGPPSHTRSTASWSSLNLSSSRLRERDSATPQQLLFTTHLVLTNPSQLSPLVGLARPRPVSAEGKECAGEELSRLFPVTCSCTW